MIKLPNIFALILLGSCASDIDGHKSETSGHKPMQEKPEATERLASANDTAILSAGPDLTYSIDFEEWVSEEVDLTQYDFLHRSGDTLFIQAQDTLIRLIDEFFDEELGNYEATEFTVAHVYPEQKVVELQAAAFEYAHHVLADLVTGDTIFSIGQPMFSENNTYIFTANVDLETQFEENGYQLIKRVPTGFDQVKTVLLEDFGIARASWEGTDSIFFRKATIDGGYNLHYEDGVVMEVKRK